MPGLNKRVFLSLGGNLGDPEQSMAAALVALDAHASVQVVNVSSLYRTRPWGRLDQPDFLNAAAELSTVLQPLPFLKLCLETERKLKRVRQERWGPRLIDIDILMFDDCIIQEAGLEIPHPRMLERAFVLAPLAELAPDLDTGGKPVSQRLAKMDISGVERLDSGRNWWRN
ncbi:2-amino-4-hydroxy-6-hydroxymethyldihydropteridine diphosphokinase [Aquamicrobium segne]|uniref:2-amino-4-hydroxy-6-hydroxymethyldihydropteridine pyrophosphokinase n=1 Tax=Aquamicrobium segne TaxID=469547 RepID=A0ABW0GWN2_9HYPH